MTDLWQLHTVWGGVAGAPYASVMHIEPVIGATPQTCADAIAAFWAYCNGAQTDDLTWQLLNEVTVIDSATGELVRVESIEGATGAGTNAAEQLPHSIQMLTQWSTAAVVAGRRRRGRTFIPGICETFNTALGVPSETLRAGLQAEAQDLVATCDGALVIYSPTHRSFSPVTGASVWNQWAVLRSRRD